MRTDPPRNSARQEFVAEGKFSSGASNKGVGANELAIVPRRFPGGLAGTGPACGLATEGSSCLPQPVSCPRQLPPDEPENLPLPGYGSIQPRSTSTSDRRAPNCHLTINVSNTRENGTRIGHARRQPTTRSPQARGCLSTSWANALTCVGEIDRLTYRRDPRNNPLFQGEGHRGREHLRTLAALPMARRTGWPRGVAAPGLPQIRTCPH